MRNTLNFHISINILVKVVLGFGALERLLHDFSRSTLIFQSLFPIIDELNSTKKEASASFPTPKT